jgi:hypothetical protein
VRGLRQSLKAHRGLRPGVLTPAVFAGLFRGLRTLGLLAVVPAFAVAILAGCSGRDAHPAVQGAAWLQLRGGEFQPAADPAAATPVARRPWTVQSRVADFAFLGDTLYCAVNGSGLASFDRDSSGAPRFSYHADPPIFGHRTITTLIPRQGSLAAHVYFNALLNDARQQDLAIAGISLVSYVPRQTDYTFLIPPFQKKNPDWEAVGFATESENSFDFEWKYTDASETRFAYTRYHADTSAEETVDRSTYLAALGVPAIEGPDVPSTLAGFFSTCLADMPTLAPGASVQFSLRSRESPVRRSYRSRKDSESAVGVPMFEEEGKLFALLPDGRVLVAEPASPPQELSLPKLPPGFSYTDFVKWGKSLVVSWEEIAFTDVGRAGLLVYTLR